MITYIKDLINNKCDTKTDIEFFSTVSVILSFLYFDNVCFDNIWCIFSILLPLVSLLFSMYILFLCRWEERLNNEINIFLAKLENHNEKYHL